MLLGSKMFAFPLFRLPLVPIRSTLDMIDLSDKINLSMSSKKTCQMIKRTGKSVSIDSLSDEQRRSLSVLDKINLVLLESYTDSDEFSRKYRISIDVQFSDDISYRFTVDSIHSVMSICFNIHVEPKHRQKRCEGTKGKLKIGNSNFPVVMKGGYHMHTFWSNKLKGFQTIGDWFKTVFKPQISIEIKVGIRKDYSENLRFVVNFINSTHRGSVRFCSMTSDTKITDEDFKFILDNVHPTLSLRLFDERCPEFQHDTSFKSHFLMLSGEWFTLDNLLKTECRNISLYESRLTCEDLTQYLKQWLAGRFANLYYLHVETQEQFDFEQIIERLSNGPLRVNDQLVKYTFARKNESISLRRNDGKVAKISTPGGQVKMFHMDVSSD